MGGVPMVEVIIGVISGRLNTNYLNPDVIERRDLLFSLVDKGYTRKEIAEILKEMGIEKLVEGTINLLIFLCPY